MAQKKRPQKGGDYQGKPKRGAEGRAKGAQGRGARSVAHQRMSQASRSQQTAAPQRRDVHAAEGNYIEGRRAAFEALRTGFPIRRALIAQGVENEPAIRDLLAGLGESGVSVRSVPRTQLDAISSHGAHQGIVLEVGKFPYADLSDIIAAAPADAPALVVVLDLSLIHI